MKLIPQEVTDYIKLKNKTLKNNYKTECGKFSESCSGIALEIAKIFLKNNQEPYIAIFYPTYKDDVSQRLTPKAYHGKINRGTHQVCVVNGLVFDPIYTKPIPIKNYSIKIFGEKIEPELGFSTEDIINIEKRLSKNKTL